MSVFSGHDLCSRRVQNGLKNGRREVESGVETPTHPTRFGGSQKRCKNPKILVEGQSFHLNGGFRSSAGHDPLSTLWALVGRKSTERLTCTTERWLAPKPLKIQKYITPVNFKGDFVIKPNCEGSSIGIKIISQDSNNKILSKFWENNNNIIAEEFIEGKELTVGVLN